MSLLGKLYTTPKILESGEKKVSYSLVFLLGMVIFLSDDTILFGTNASKSYLIFKNLVYLIVTLGLLTNLNLKVFRSRGIYFISAIVASILLTLLSNLDFTGGYVYQIWIVFLAFLITQSLDFEVFASLFKKYIFILCLFSILIFIIANYYEWILDYFPTGENTAGVEFVNLYVGSVYKGVGEVRNSSIFREPGVFAIYILLAIMFELFLSIKMKVNIKFIACFLIALFATFSTTAFAVMALMTIGYMFKDGAAHFQSKIVLVALFFMIVTFVFGFQEDLYFKVFSKLDTDSISFESSIARVASIVVNFEIFINHPLFGSGLGNYGNLFQTYSNLHFGVPLEASGLSTNSFMSVLATYGLLYGLIIMLALMRLPAKLSDRFVVKTVLFISFVLMFSSQDMRYSLLFNILVFYGLKLSGSVFYRPNLDQN
ncbi:MAG: O-antigen ligase family protein [Polaromonas sp.]|uniref:O-antigen ligase family protein n=1 Tax=Polaromonas sp. TaxID=1869339 RepID=UPI001812CF21|nr:O-antigen ligase family protein [Polaromonas sp.]NMM11433.1 O-antigen ligase family protein [Polaromonas sp.]